MLLLYCSTIAKALVTGDLLTALKGVRDFGLEEKPLRETLWVVTALVKMGTKEWQREAESPDHVLAVNIDDVHQIADNPYIKPFDFGCE